MRIVAAVLLLALSLAAFAGDVYVLCYVRDGKVRFIETKLPSEPVPRRDAILETQRQVTDRELRRHAVVPEEQVEVTKREMRRKVRK